MKNTDRDTEWVRRARARTPNRWRTNNEHWTIMIRTTCTRQIRVPVNISIILTIKTSVDCVFVWINASWLFLELREIFAKFKLKLTKVIYLCLSSSQIVCYPTSRLLLANFCSSGWISLFAFFCPWNFLKKITCGQNFQYMSLNLVNCFKFM